MSRRAEAPALGGTRMEWGVRLSGGETVSYGTNEALARKIAGRVPGARAFWRTVTYYAADIGEWHEVDA